MEVRIGPVFKNGQVVAFISSSTDITERKKAEEALRQSEEYFHSLTDNAVDVILVIGADGVRKYVSPSIERVRGYKPEELIGKEAIEGVHPDDVPKIADIFVQLTENPGKLLQWECRLRHKDGTWRIVEGISRNLFDNPVVAGIVSNYRDITERKRAEEALRNERDNMLNALNAMKDGVYIINQQNDIVYTNPSTKEEFGPHEGKKCYEYFHDFKEPCHLCDSREVFAGKAVRSEWFSPKTDKTYEIVHTPFRETDGSMLKLSIIRDITERKKLEEQERRRSQDLDLLSKAAVSLIELPYDADIHHFIAERLQELAEGSAVLVNSFDEASDTFRLREALGIGEQMEAFTKILGFNLIGMPAPISDEARQGLSSSELAKVQGGIYELASGAIPMPVCQEIEKLLDVGNVYAIGFAWEGRLYGSAVILTRSKTELRNKDVIETFVRQASIALQRRQAEEALKESEEKYRALIEATGRAGEGIIIIQDREEREAAFVFVNDEFCKMSGYSREELLNRSAWDLVPYEVAMLLKDWYKRRHMGESLPGHYEAAGVRKDGTIVPLDLSVVTMLWQGKIATVLYMRDITERKRMEEEIRASLKEKEALLSEVHHRVKNNFQLISSLLDMVGMRARNEETIRVCASVHARVHAMGLIHSQLYQSGSFAQIDMEAHVKELVGYLAQVYATSGRRITPVIDASGVYLSITPAVPCALALNEVISNAFKHAFQGRQKGAIEISLRKSAEGMVTMRVKDDGIGMPEDFDIDKTNTLGLKLTRNLVQEQLKGSIQFKRSNGTEVTIEFKVG
jgi:PAS domain S-box-containing protein